MREAATANVGLEWCDKLKLGYEPMDETHEEFVRIVNQMLTCADRDLMHYLTLFATHAEAHFAQELVWMHATAFPSMDCHVREHDAVMRSVREVQSLLESGEPPDIARRLAAELASWFPAHADYLDASLAQWIVKQRHGGVPVVLRRNMQFAA